MDDIRRHVLVRGRVQGVGFRYWTRGEAERLSVRGWVTNRTDESVEAELEGEPGAVDELIAVMGRGPRGAVVDHIEVSDLPPTGEAGFSIVGGARGRMSGWFRRD